MTERLTLPVLPLRDFVLFPGVTAPINAGKPATLKAIEAALNTPERLVFAVSQREDVQQVSPEVLHTIGTVARIGTLQRGLAGIQLLLHGEHRGIAMKITEGNGYLQAVVREAEEMKPLNPQDPAFVGLFRELRERAAELGTKSGLPEEVVTQVLEGVDDPGRLADLVAGYTDVTKAQRQMLLETLSVEERMRRVLVHVQRQLSVLEAQEDIKTKVQEELGDRQREMFLREQLRAIQKELGEGDTGEEMDDLRQKLAGLELPEVVRKEVDRELGRLGRMGREAMESQVIRTYLETIAELPWNKRSPEHLDIPAAAEILEQDHYALGDVKDRVLEFLAVRQLRQAEEEARKAEETKAEETVDATAGTDGQEKTEAPAAPVTAEEKRKAKGPILLFVGPPGVGKTSVAKSIARAMGREYVRVSLGGVRDEADIRGHRRTYVGAMPGRVIQGIHQAGTSNPVFMLDEIDKIGADYRGDPSAALLEVLDPEQNFSFRDHYLSVPYDLSKVLFIATANVLDPIQPAFLDRMEVIRLSGYTLEEKKAIAKRHLIPKQMEENGITDANIEFTDAGIEKVIEAYTREAGLRNLEREIGAICRKVAVSVAKGKARRYRIAGASVEKMLGPVKHFKDEQLKRDEVGVATGLAWTSVGGDMLFVEALAVRGKGGLRLTGQLGDVMKESAQAAMSYARAHAADLKIAQDFFETHDVHVHVPEGAIPKDGPSAGITIATAMISAFTGRKVRRDVAMTGEITLRGEVLPIGGVKEKVLAARAAKIPTIILPRQNRRDVVQISAKIVHEIAFRYVDTMQEVLEIALVPVDAEAASPGAPPGKLVPEAPGREIPVTASGGRRRAPASPTPRA